MSCFAVPVVEAVVTTVAAKVIERKEKREENSGNDMGRVNFSSKLKWLNNMLWGGSALLAFEHAWHGEIVPFFPFLTNAADAAQRAEMLKEMATTGVGMTVAVTAVWLAMVAVAGAAERRAAGKLEAVKEEA